MSKLRFEKEIHVEAGDAWAVSCVPTVEHLCPKTKKWEELEHSDTDANTDYFKCHECEKVEKLYSQSSTTHYWSEEEL